MSQEARYYRVGLFVLLGTGLLTVFVVLLGGTDMFRTPVRFESYFAESVQGLEVGSPVKIRGVPLGTVSHIGFVDDFYTFENESDRLTYGQKVIVRFQYVDSETSPTYAAERARVLQDMIDRGLRVRLAQQGITGTAYIEADFLDPEKNPPMKIIWEPELYYVPSAPSVLKSISTAAERIFQRLENVEVEKVVAHLDDLIVSLDDVVDTIDVASVQDQAVAVLDDVRETSESLRAILQDDDTVALSGDVRDVVKNLNQALLRVRQMVEASGPGLAATLDNLRVVSEDLRDVANTARSYPSVLLLGQPPPQVEPTR